MSDGSEKRKAIFVGAVKKGFIEEMIQFEVCLKEEIAMIPELGHHRNCCMKKPMKVENADFPLEAGIG